MSQKISDAGTQPKLSASKTAIWTLAAIALLLLPLFMMSSLTQAATDVSGDAFPIRQCSVRNRINKITNDEMVARFDGLNQSGSQAT